MVRDTAEPVQLLQNENASLRSQLEAAYLQMVKMAETVQTVHLARISEAAKSSVPEATNHKDTKNKDADGGTSFLSDYEANVSYMDAQHQALVRRTGVSAAEQAEQLRSLENKARKWAKKFLYKVKAAASKAEAMATNQQAAGGSSIAPHAAGATRKHNGRGPLETIDSVPSQDQSTARQTPRTPNSEADRATPARTGVGSTRKDGNGAAAPRAAHRSAQPQAAPSQQALAAQRSGDSAASPRVFSADPPLSGGSSPAATPTGLSAGQTAIPRRSGTRSTLETAASDAARLQARRGSDAAASANAHLHRPAERAASGELNPMLDSTRSDTENGASVSGSRSKKRFHYFNTLFKQKSGRPSS